MRPLRSGGFLPTNLPCLRAASQLPIPLGMGAVRKSWRVFCPQVLQVVAALRRAFEDQLVDGFGQF